MISAAGQLGSPDLDCRRAAARSLFDGGAVADDVPALCDALGDPDCRVRMWAAGALGKIPLPMGPSRSRDRLHAMSKGDAEPLCRAFARFALRRMVGIADDPPEMAKE